MTPHVKDSNIDVRPPVSFVKFVVSRKEGHDQHGRFCRAAGGHCGTCRPDSARPLPLRDRATDAVSRDQASEALGIARHTAKFHLDKPAEEGLLDASFKRLSERRGPGAGRPTKLYARSSRQLFVTLPERRYDLAGQLLATAIDNAAGERTTVTDALNAAAETGAAPSQIKPEQPRVLGQAVNGLLPRPAKR